MKTDLDQYLPRKVREDERLGHQSKTLIATVFRLASEQLAAYTGMPRDETLKGLVGLCDAGYLKLIMDMKEDTLALRPCLEDGTVVEEMQGFVFKIGSRDVDAPDLPRA
jgi:hypothetical protein